MDPIVEKLVSLYAKAPFGAVEKNPNLLKGEFDAAPEELANQWGFPEKQELVRSQRKLMEDNKESLSAADDKNQLIESLNLILNRAMFEKTEVDLKLDVLRALMLEMFGNAAWTEPQKAHFERTFTFIKNWNSFFLSYTNHNAKKINMRFKDVIKAHVDEELLRDRDWSKDNLLADAVLAVLYAGNLAHSFYDKADIGIGDDLFDKIEPAAGNVFAFVQLVQLETFSAIEKRNWCFEEYQVFIRANKRDTTGWKNKKVFKKRFNAILAEQSRPAEGALPLEYEPWEKRIFEDELHAELPTNPEKFQKMVLNLSREIMKLKHQIIANVP